MEIVYDQDAYNSVGEHLDNDDRQSRQMLAGIVLAAIICAVLMLAVLL